MMGHQTRTAAARPERPGLANQLPIHGVESPRQSGDEQRSPGQIMPALFQLHRSLPIPGDQVHGSFLVSFAHRRHRPRAAESLSNSPARLQPPLAKRMTFHCLSVFSLACSLVVRFTSPLHHAFTSSLAPSLLSPSVPQSRSPRLYPTPPYAETHPPLFADPTPPYVFCETVKL